MDVWIVQNALTKGIFKINGRVELRDMSTVKDIDRKPGTGPGFYCGDSWTDCEKTAKIMADTMRIKKIMSLKKEIERLKNLEF